jgi:putative Mn2+ efflux pump MntP
MSLGRLLRTHWDRAAALAFGLSAVIALLAGWAGLSATPYVAEQLSYLLSGGIGAVILLGIGATLWLSADLRDEWRELDSIDDALRDLVRLGSIALPIERPQESGR